MNKKEIHDELIRIRTELILNKKDSEKCKSLEEEHNKMRKELAKVLKEEIEQHKEQELGKIK